jgi:predicted acetyltransferase
MGIYRSLGWEMAGHRYEAVLPARALRSMPGPELLDSQALKAVRRPGPDDAAEVSAVAGRVYELARDSGPAIFDEAIMRRWLAGADAYTYLAPDGFLAYRWQRGHDEIYVEQALAASAQTTAALWSVVASHSSVAGTVRAQVGPSDPFWWLLREREANVAERDSWMLRLLDAPAAIAARGFPAAASLAVPLVIADDLCPANTGRWELTVRAGAGFLSAYGTGRGASSGHAVTHEAGVPLILGARGLAALYAGTPVATLRRAGLAEGGSADGDAALDAAFAATPYMLDNF